MLDYINALLELFGDFCLFFLNAPFYGSVKVGYVIIAMAIMGIMFNFFVRRM